MAKKGGLGRGLDALFDDNQVNTADEAKGETITTVRISDVEPDKTQPRKVFDHEALSALADSISRHGILQPIVVRRAEGSEGANDAVSKILSGKYRIVAGERRWRAAKLAGLSEVPVIVKSFTEKEAAAIMLVENLQRENLNPVEQAMGLSRLMKEFELTQEEAAQIVGISRPALTNALRLLALPKEVLTLLEDGTVTPGHARALLPLSDKDSIIDAAEAIAERDMSVRDTERYVKLLLQAREEKAESVRKSKSTEEKAGAAYRAKVESNASAALGRKLKIVPSSKKPSEGRIEIRYHSSQDLEAFLKAICGNDVFPED